MKKQKYAKEDFKYSSLPNTRKDAFKDVYRNNFSTIMKCGISLLLFSLPLIIFIVIMDIWQIGIVNSGYDEEVLRGVILWWNLTLHLGSVLLVYLILVGFCGVLRVIKLLIWQEGIDYLYDFKVGIKENFKHFSLFYLFASLFYIATCLVKLFLLAPLVGLALIIVYLLMFIPLFMWGILSVNVYQTRLKEYIKNSAFFFSRTIGISFVFLILIVWPFFSIYLPVNMYTIMYKAPVVSILILFYYPCLLIVLSLYSCSKFDKYINQDNFPDYYRKGLYDTQK